MAPVLQNLRSALGLRRRFFLRLLLLAPLNASLVLAVQSWRQYERYEGAVANALTQQARMLLGSYVQNVDARLWMLGQAAFAGGTKVPAAAGEPLLDWLTTANAAIPDCHCAPPVAARAVFWFDIEKGTSGSRALRDGAEGEVRAALADLRRRHPRASRPSPFLIHAGTSPRPWFAIYALPSKNGGKGTFAYGFLADLDTLSELVFGAAYQLLQLDTGGTTVSGDALRPYLSIRADLPPDGLIWRSVERYAETYSARRPMFEAVSEIQLTLALNPDRAGNVISGGLPKSPLFGLAVIVASGFGLALLGLLLLRRAERLQSAHEEFAARISHELRTPLTQILLYAESLALGRVKSEERRERALTVLLREARHLIHLVDNALAFTRAGRSSAGISRRVQALAPIAEEAASALAPLLETHRSLLIRDLDSSVSAAVDATALRQVLINLIDNALRHGGRDQTIHLTLRADQDQAVITVDDQGPGISRFDRERIFRPFLRLKESTGSGLGLAIVRQLVELHDGTIAVRDAPGPPQKAADRPGARFEIRLPLAALDVEGA